jgi:hypothetical protein
MRQNIFFTDGGGHFEKHNSHFHSFSPHITGNKLKEIKSMHLFMLGEAHSMGLYPAHKNLAHFCQCSGSHHITLHIHFLFKLVYEFQNGSLLMIIT